MPLAPKPVDTPIQSAVYVGIDPGQSGGLVAIYGRQPMLTATPMPDTERGVWEWFRTLAGLVQVYAVIEKVHSMPSQGVSSSFTFGKNYGFLRGCLTAAGIPFEEVTPQVWMKALGVPPRRVGKKQKAKKKGKWVVQEIGGESKAEYKLRLLSIAQQKFPQLPLWREPRSKGKQLAVCDALLIAYYSQQKYAGRQ